MESELRPFASLLLFWVCLAPLQELGLLLLVDSLLAALTRPGVKATGSCALGGGCSPSCWSPNRTAVLSGAFPADGAGFDLCGTTGSLGPQQNPPSRAHLSHCSAKSPSPSSMLPEPLTLWRFHLTRFRAALGRMSLLFLLEGVLRARCVSSHRFLNNCIPSAQ